MPAERDFVGIKLSLPADAKLVHKELVREIEDVSNELVVHAHAICKVRSRENGIANLLAHICLDALHDTIDRSRLNIVPHHKEIEPAFKVAREDSRDEDELDASRLLDLANDGLVLERMGAQEELGKGLREDELRVEEVCLYPLLFLDDLLPLPYLKDFDRRHFLDEAEALEVRDLDEDELLPGEHLLLEALYVEHERRVKEEEANHLDAKLGSEES